MQTLLTFLIIALAVGYALWRGYRVLQRKNNPCCGCEGCPLKDARTTGDGSFLCDCKKK